MTSLANTTWTLTLDGAEGYQATVTFGEAQYPTGGSGNFSDNQGANNSIYWVENTNDFMFQMQNQDSSYTTLTTYTGHHATGAGSGWSSNFSVNASTTGFSIIKA